MYKILPVSHSKTYYCFFAFAFTWNNIGIGVPIDYHGDLRFRTERVKQPEATDDRTTEGKIFWRSMLRARLQLDLNINEKIQTTLRFASGNDQITTANVEIGDGFQNKTFGIEQAYLQFKPLSKLEIAVGKVASPMYRPGGSEMVWDKDLSPEGIYGLCRSDFDKLRIKSLIASFTFAENQTNDDREIGVAAVQTEYMFSEEFQFILGVSQFLFSKTKGSELIEDTGGNTYESIAFGDEPANVYLNNYTVLEMFSEAIYILEGRRLSFYYHSIENVEASKNNRGLAYGLGYGLAKAKGSWSAKVHMRQTESDTTVSLFDDNNFNLGQTGGKGFIASGSYAFYDDFLATLSHFNFRRNNANNAYQSANRGSVTQIDLTTLF